MSASLCAGQVSNSVEAHNVRLCADTTLTGLSKQVSFQGDTRPGDWAIENFLLTPSGFMWPKVTTKSLSFTTRL